MHDLDRTMQELEFDQEHDEFEYGNQMEYDGEYDEMEYDGEYADEAGDYEVNYEYDSEYEAETGSPFSEEEEMELAAELLSVNNEAELDQFIGRLLKKARGKLSKLSQGFNKVVGGVSKIAQGVIKKALPIAGKAVGGMFGGPLGSKIGGMAGSAASRFFELELEGMSHEDQEFEVAKRMVRFTGAATKNAAQLGQKMPANKAIKTGFKAAAKKHAPGLLKPNTNRKMGNANGMTKGRIVRSGRWIMRDDKRIVILGL